MKRISEVFHSRILFDKETGAVQMIFSKLNMKFLGKNVIQSLATDAKKNVSLVVNSHSTTFEIDLEQCMFTPWSLKNSCVCNFPKWIKKLPSPKGVQKMFNEFQFFFWGENYMYVMHKRPSLRSNTNEESQPGPTSKILRHGLNHDFGGIETQKEIIFAKLIEGRTVITFFNKSANSNKKIKQKSS